MTKENPYRSSEAEQTEPRKPARRTMLTVVAVFFLLLGVLMAVSLLSFCRDRR